MAQFQPKFKIGDVVTIIDTKSPYAKYFTGEVKVHAYEKGSDHPYRLTNGCRAQANEIKLVQPEAVKEEEIEIIPLVTSLPKEEVKVNMSKALFDAQKFTPGQPVKIVFIPEENQFDFFGISDSHKYDLTSCGGLNHYRKHVGVTGVIREVDERNHRYAVTYSTSGWDWYDAISLQSNGLAKPLVYTFQGSEDRNVKVLSDTVFIGDEEFSFELFDNLLTAVRKQEKGENQPDFKISRQWTGVFCEKHLQVGCQKFSYENIKRLAAAIRVARSLT